jgi:hypothetical protein
MEPFYGSTMLDLNSPRWKELKHHFGDANDTAIAIQELAACLDEVPRSEARYRLALDAVESEIEKLTHQCNLCDAADAAFPHLYALTPRLHKSDQPGMYHSLGWAHSEGAGKFLEDAETSYKESLETGKLSILELARSMPDISFEEQRTLYYAVSCLHDLQTMFFIRDDYHDIQCEECGKASTFNLMADGCYRWTENDQLLEPSSETNVGEKLDSFHALKFLHDIARPGNHVAMTNWLTSLVVTFACPKCGLRTCLYEAV